jgi:hypothetical protein
MGAMDKLISDCAKAEMSERVKQFFTFFVLVLGIMNHTMRTRSTQYWIWPVPLLIHGYLPWCMCVYYSIILQVLLLDGRPLCKLSLVKHQTSPSSYTSLSKNQSTTTCILIIPLYIKWGTSLVGRCCYPCWWWTHIQDEKQRDTYRSPIRSTMNLSNRNHRLSLLGGEQYPITLAIKFLSIENRFIRVFNRRWDGIWMMIQVSNDSWLPLIQKS